MRHFVYYMFSTAPAPAGDGDTKSWFQYYKWDAEGETYVPVKSPFLAAEAGDFLWFVMDHKVLGAVPVLRVETPPLPTQKQEIWFDAREIIELERTFAPTLIGNFELEESDVKKLLALGKKRTPA